MKVGFNDLGGKLPNLALMKLSAKHRAEGDEVYLNPSFKVDRLYVSCIFSWEAKRINPSIDECEVVVGGFGVNRTRLPDDVEHLMPDYSLYKIDYSMGFTTRGCFMNCSFCNVPELEGSSVVEWSPFEEFIHPRHRKAMLLDYQFLGSSKWREKLLYLIKRGLEVNFLQGVDARLVTEDAAKLLSHVKYRTKTFKEKRLHIAWDRMKDEGSVLKGIERLKAYGVNDITCYMLIGYDTSIEDDLYRFHRLRELDVDPFPMLYNNQGDSMRRHFRRWASKPWLYKTIPFREYSRLSPGQRAMLKPM